MKLHALLAGLASAALALSAGPVPAAPAPAPPVVGVGEGEGEELERPVDLEAFRLRIADEERAPVSLYVTMATWCPSCAKEQPQTTLLRERFDDAQLAFFGVPIDPKEGPDKLAEYAERKAPGYRILADRELERVMELRRVLFQAYHVDMLPGSVAVDAEGRVLQTFPGLPTYSQLRRLVRQQTGR